MVFFSYRTKHESPAGDQFWKFSHKCSIFGCIGDQWVAISSPGLLLSFSQERVKVSKSANSPSYPLILSYSYQNNIYFNLVTQFSRELTSDTQLDPRWFNLSYFEFHIKIISCGFAFQSFTISYFELPLLRPIFLFPLRVWNTAVQLYFSSLIIWLFISSV